MHTAVHEIGPLMTLMMTLMMTFRSPRCRRRDAGDMVRNFLTTVSPASTIGFTTIDSMTIRKGSRTPHRGAAEERAVAEILVPLTRQRGPTFPQGDPSCATRSHASGSVFRYWRVRV
jgi:hypothetical protein